MIWHCSSCHYTFKSGKDTVSCPDCGKDTIRHATKNEITESQKYWEEYDRLEALTLQAAG